MKKLISFVVIGLLFCSQAHAGVISYTALSSDAGVSYSHFNDSFTTIYNEFNGGIDSDNIENDSLKEADMADEINPRIRSDEQLGDYTFTGHLPADSANLTSDISAGTSYVEGFRVVTSATSKTYTATKDTWVYIDINGTFQYEEVAVGAAQPTTPANSLLLATVTTDATEITTVTDRRVTAPPAIRTYQDARTGFIPEYSSATQIIVGSGEIELGASGLLRRNTTNTTVTWSDLDTGAEAASTTYYVWAYPDANNSSNAAFKISTSSSDATGVDNERLVGWFYNDANSDISQDAIGSWKGDGSGVPNLVQELYSTDIETTVTAGDGDLMSGMRIDFVCSGRPVKIGWEAPFRADAVTGTVSIRLDDVVVKSTACENGSNKPIPASVTYVAAGSRLLGPGPHKAEIYWKTTAGTIYQDGSTYGGRTFWVEEQ